MTDENKETDLDLEFIASEEEDLDIDEAPYKIRTQGADLTLELYSQKIQSGEIVIPDFQRKYVWPPKKASKLIESFLLGLPVPQVFLYQEAERRDLLVVDGQQRLLSSHFFLSGFFEDRTTPFRLRGVKSKWEGKAFNDLDEGDKRRLKNYILRATIFEQIDPADSKSVYEIFERLNTGGMPLTAQEVRNCVNRGNINSFVDQVNKEPSWRALLGRSEPDKRMKDIEMVLRVLALVAGWSGYKPPMKDFISSYMEANTNISTETQERLRGIFVPIVKFIHERISVEAFRLSAGRVNVAVLDSVIVAIAEIGLENLGESFKESLVALKKNEAYLALVSRATTDEDSLKGRIKMAIEALKK